MTVKEYHQQGLRYFIDKEPENLKYFSEQSEGAHKIKLFFLKDGTCRWWTNKRCKKLMALADVACHIYNTEKRVPTDEELLEFFKEEKDEKKMQTRINLLLKTFGI